MIANKTKLERINSQRYQALLAPLRTVLISIETREIKRSTYYHFSGVEFIKLMIDKLNPQADKVSIHKLESTIDKLPTAFELDEEKTERLRSISGTKLATYVNAQNEAELVKSFCNFLEHGNFKT